MINQITSRFNSFRSIISSVADNIPYGVVFALDTLSATLFSFAILALFSNLPDPLFITLQIVFIALTSCICLYFLSRRIYSMAFFKICLIAFLYAIKEHIYYM